jgi:2-dehydro-3-deoxygalactonokinase
MTRAALFAIDWGTTSARAYRLGAGGEVLDVRSAPLGISQIHDGRFAEALARLLADWQHEHAPRIASGIVHVPEGNLAVVPGASTHDAHGMPDVMRGEETQIVGCVEPQEARVLVVMPGTHSKWAYVEAGRIVDFMTFMTGEIWHLLLAHSILGRLAVQPPPDAGIGPGFARGVVRGLGAGNLVHDVFGARTMALMGQLAGADVADWLSGIMIGREVRNARTWAHRYGYDGARVRLIGEDALMARYALALSHADIDMERADGRAAALGLWRIALQAGIVEAFH